jgi:hypothetical protein
MLSQKEFLALALENTHYEKARAILKAHNTDFSLYSCSEKIIDELLSIEGKHLDDLIENIRQANETKTELQTVLTRKRINNMLNGGIEDFFKAFEDPEDKSRLFLLVGETGVGKSYMVEKRYPDVPNYACRKDLDSYSLCYYLADNEGTGLKPYETPFLKALKNGGRVIMDEFNELPHDSLMLIQGITDERQTIVIGNEIIKISPNFKIMATMNPNSESDARNSLGDALLGRAVGYILELTDEQIAERLNCSQKWLANIRKLHTFVRNSGMIDIRGLNFRDFYNFKRYGFLTQFKFKVCQGDITNIKNYTDITETGEFLRLLEEIEKCK